MSTPPPIEFKDWVQGLTEVTDPAGIEALVVIREGQARRMPVDGAVSAAHFQSHTTGPVEVDTEADDNDAPTNWVNVLDFVTPILAAGEFEFNVQVVWTLGVPGRPSVRQRKAFFRFGLDGQYSDVVRLAAEDQRVVTAYKAIGPIAAEGVHTLTIDALIEERGGSDPSLQIGSALVTLERKRSA